MTNRSRKPPPPGKKDPAATEAPKGERIAKRLARAGLCSRRDAERWIEAGRVAVDGQVLTTPAFLVTADSRIIVDGQPLQAAEPTRLWRFHKPAGVMTTARDPQKRPTVFERLPKSLPRVVAVGRLDFNTEGLLLLTNDGELARYLELPSTGWARRYRVRVYGRPKPADLAGLKDGITIEGVHYGPIDAELERQQGANAWLALTLREGKNREVRRVCEHLGLTVNRLIRVSYGPFQLGSLEDSKVAEVPNKVLRDQIGDKVPGLAGPPPPAPRTRLSLPKAKSPAKQGAAQSKSGGKRPAGGKSPKGRAGKPGSGSVRHSEEAKGQAQRRSNRRAGAAPGTAPKNDGGGRRSGRHAGRRRPS